MEVGMQCGAAIVVNLLADITLAQFKKLKGY